MKISSVRVPLIGVALIAAGCGGDSRVSFENEGTVGVELPGQLRRIAALDNTTLTLEVTVNDGSPVRVSNQSTDSWQATVSVPKDQPNDIKLEWSTTAQGQKVLLADFDTQVGATQESLTVNDSSYSTSGADRFNLDNDPFTNLQEVDENRNPLDRIDLVIPRSDATFLSPSIGFNEVEDSEVSLSLIHI